MTFFLYFLYFLPLFLLSLTLLKNLQSSKCKLPPGPWKFPIIGNLHNLKGLPHLCLRNLAEKYGPIMLLHFGFVPMVIISSSKGAEEVLKIHDLECCSRPETVATRTISYNFKDIGFAPYGEEWKAMRKLAVIELFSAKKIQSFKYIREEENVLFVKKLSEFATKQSLVNLKTTLFTLVASIVCRIAFGVDIHKSKFIDEDRIAELVHKFEVVIGTSMFSDVFPCGLGSVIDRISGKYKRLNNVFAELDEFFQNVLDEHFRPGRIVLDSPDVVDVMIDMMNKQEKDNDDESFKLTTDHLKGIISDIFLAGVNTSVITLTWAMTELIRNPRVMNQVQVEIRTKLGENKDKITEQDLNQLNYFKLVVKETFRLHPPAPLLLPRETLSEIDILGSKISAKTQLMINVYAIARDPKLWKNPDEFNPDRFFDNSIDYKGLNFELLPFGSGRRICPGMSMGIATVELGLLNLLYFFDWRLPQGIKVKDIDLEESGSIIIGKKMNLELVPILHFQLKKL